MHRHFHGDGGVEDGLVNATNMQKRNQSVQQSLRSAAVPVLTPEMMAELIIGEAVVETYSGLLQPNYRRQGGPSLQRVTNVFMANSKALRPHSYVGPLMSTKRFLPWY